MTIIICLVILVGITFITSWKSWNDIFNPFPSLPSKMEMEQFQSLNIVLNNKTGLLFLEFI